MLSSFLNLIGHRYPLQSDVMYRYLISILILAAASAVSAANDESNVWDFVSNYKGWPVSSVKASGLDAARLPSGTAKQLAKGLDLASDKAVLYEKQLREDVARIQLHLAQHGYPYARVTPRVDPDETKRTVALTFDIESGPPVIVRTFDWSNVPEKHKDDLNQAMRTRLGDVFSDTDSESDVQLAIDHLKKIGHAYAGAVAQIDWVDSTTVDIAVVAMHRPVYFFSGVIIQGVSDDLIELAYVMVDISAGERYDPILIRDAREYLSRLGVFRQIRLTLEQTAPDSLDVIVDLQKRKPRSIETAVGYWTDEQFSGRIKWQHRDIFHKARGMSIEVNYTQFRQFGKWNTWWPAIFGKKRSLGSLSAGLNNENEDNYEKTAPGVGVQFGYTFTRNTVGTIGYTIELASYDIKSSEKEIFQDPEGPVGWFSGRVSRDGTDDRISPVKGTFSWLALQWGPRGGVSEANWISAEGSGTIMVPIKQTVFAANIRPGWGHPIAPAENLLPDRRFYAGGAVSHRGFYRRKLGPKDENAVALGGEVMLTGFFEYRFPLVWKFRGAVFFDWGQVWRTRGDVRSDNIELAVGPALRLMTPVGPVRLDWGIRITNYDETQPWSAIHFAIGYPM
jgi:outer membrane protein assembly factor BamA